MLMFAMSNVSYNSKEEMEEAVFMSVVNTNEDAPKYRGETLLVWNPAFVSSIS